MRYFYISFATDAGFRGATVVRARDSEHALQEATHRGLNPGGEAAIIEIPKDAEQEPDMRAMINRLVGKEEMLAAGAKRHADCPQDIQDAFERDAEIVCDDCNR